MSKEVVFPFDVAKVYQMFGLCKCLGRKMKNIFSGALLFIPVLLWSYVVCVCVSMVCVFCAMAWIFAQKRF